MALTAIYTLPCQPFRRGGRRRLFLCFIYPKTALLKGSDRIQNRNRPVFPNPKSNSLSNRERTA